MCRIADASKPTVLAAPCVVCWSTVASCIDRMRCADHCSQGELLGLQIQSQLEAQRMLACGTPEVHLEAGTREVWEACTGLPWVWCTRLL
jgi:hypothetical protein